MTPDRRITVSLIISLIVGLAVAAVYGPRAYHRDILSYEFSGDPGSDAEALDRAVRADFGFIVGYTLVLGSLALLLRAHAHTERVHRIASAFVVLTVAAALFDYVEDAALLQHNGTWSAPFATLKFLCLIPVVVGLPVLYLVNRRAARHR
ncbi:MAG: hypothetical protein QM728_00195 [Gordonia sp. (in: high G+C Gram-positive bacteria)]|uniref:hypothetical protein n=1 Tax=Gordonia sp. (in: high G+C Gram-positive bacteria) TaxID=84139 RepID=UPI0039E6AFEA